ncbi:hypothetical protein CVT25_005247 [Psilocybe cyanescens]|uniref:Uncharacterized protein n=1 Tax=Psilocybe cyanescens TaxID=93625 RepID=A0A409W7X3_PSICY|nr:hypothetical protein CVT25_005247 [Psilocybe cyanescens]
MSPLTLVRVSKTAWSCTNRIRLRRFSSESAESNCNGRCLVDTEHLLLLPPPHPHGGGVESFRESSPKAYVVDHQRMKERMSHIVRSKEGSNPPHALRWTCPPPPPPLPPHPRGPRPRRCRALHGNLKLNRPSLNFAPYTSYNAGTAGNVRGHVGAPLTSGSGSSAVASRVYVDTHQQYTKAFFPSRNPDTLPQNSAFFTRTSHTGRWLTAWEVVAAIKGPVSGHGAGAGEPSSSSSRASRETCPHDHDHEKRERWGRRMPILNVRPVQGMPFVPAAAAGKSVRVAGKDADGAGAGSRRGRAMRKDVDVDVDDQA